jgi:hypothetical protein
VCVFKRTPRGQLQVLCGRKPVGVEDGGSQGGTGALSGPLRGPALEPGFLPRSDPGKTDLFWSAVLTLEESNRIAN